MKVQDRFQEMLLPISRKIKNECNYNTKSFTEEMSFIKLDYKSINGDNHQSDIAFLKKEVIAEFNAFIDGQLKEIIRRRKKILSDLMVKIISGIVGGLIVYFLTKPFLWQFFLLIINAN